MLVGAVTELGQDLLPWERHSSWADFGFDVLGVAVGIGLARALWPRPMGERPATW